MRLILSLFFLFTPLMGYAQDCDCIENFNWVQQTFEENDAGFSFVLDSKGKEAYAQHNDAILAKAEQADNITDCSRILREWLAFFRSGHIDLQLLPPKQEDANANGESEAQSGELYPDWERLDVDLKKFERRLAAKKTADYEGIWLSEPYTIGVKKTEDGYKGFIIEADGVFWSKGQVKFEIKNDQEAVYYMRDHSAQEFDQVALLGDNYLQIGFITLKRLAPKSFPDDPKLETYFKTLSTEVPFFEVVDEQTTLLRIPSFNGVFRAVIDSLIFAHKDQIAKTENLIIDIRNNGGGSDRCFRELLPFIYTNPIRTVGVEMYSTKLNNQRMLDFINKPEYNFDEEGKKWAQESYDLLSKRVGEFVDMDSTRISITTLDEVMPYPKNVGIIMNENNASTAEQFLLAAKQSKKVKLFGRTTAGILDISNMYYVESPCKEFVLGYGLSKSMRLPDMVIDDIGIQPDFYLDKEIPEYDWVEFVSKRLGE